MNKITTPKNPNIKWPKTQARKAAELQQRQDAIGSVAAAAQIMTAAGAVPMPRSKKLMADAAQAANSRGIVGKHAKGKKGKKRAWQEHADEYFASNNAWDEVNGIYVACIDLLRTSLALTPLLKEKALLALVFDKKLLTRNVQAITRDTQALATELAKIRATHEGKGGGSKSQEEMMESCAVFSQYVNFMERYDSALMPLVVHASEQLQEALIALEVIDPELAQRLSQDLQATLGSIQSIVHEVTGADAVQTPVAETVVQQETPAEASV